MDRNAENPMIRVDEIVALRKESVDRNLVGSINRTINIVALRKESVDRNHICANNHIGVRSLSARRAWIEIDFSGSAWVSEFVALRKESVDRNAENPMIRVDEITSLSARRAWIEMDLPNV